jgi:nucleoside-diphosphate-sugar epimerase
MKENDVPEPHNNYGISKVASTLYCQSIAINENLPVITLRLFSPYGNYEDPTRLIPSVVLSCLKDENPKISSTTFVRDFIYVEDVIEAYTKIPIDGSIPCGIFNIGSGKQFSVGEIVNNIIQITKSNVTPIIGLPQKWPNEPELWQADISKAASMLNWIPKYDINTGLKMTVKWFENNLQYYQ